MTAERMFPPPLVRFSALKHMARSAAHYREAVIHPKEQTPAMRFGTLCHTLILGGDRFAVFEGKTRNGKAWDAFEEAHAGQLIVKADELERGLDVARRVQSHPLAAPLLVGKREHELAWTTLGRPCGGRLDVCGDGFVADVKMSASSEPAWFTRNGMRLAYGGQLAWYRAGMRANGLRCDDGYLIACEPKEPYAITVFGMSGRAFEQGDRLNRALLERVLVCEAADEWPAYSQSVEVFDVPDDIELTYGDEPESEAA